MMADLRLDPENARKHSERNAAMVRQSLEETGPFRSIAADGDDIVRAGNLTFIKAQELGFKMRIVEAAPDELIVVKRPDLHGDAAKRAALWDNRTSDPDVGSEWDADVIARIQERDAALLAGVFERDEVAEILALAKAQEPVADPGAQVDRASELQEKWGTAAGQVWEIGLHRVMCGDCTDRAVVEAAMQGEKADLLWTDPPYNVNYKGNYIQSGQILREDEKIWQGGMSNDALEDFGNWLQSAYQVIDVFLSEGCALYIWHPPGGEGRHFWKAWLWDKWHFQVDLVWNKTSLIVSRWDYNPQHEPFMYGWKGKGRNWAGASNESTVWDMPRQQGRSGEARYHPTQKLPELVRRCIRNHNASVILDPFLGSGTTAVACEQLGRKCRGVEISPACVAVSLQRLSDLGLEPRLVEQR